MKKGPLLFSIALRELTPPFLYYLLIQKRRPLSDERRPGIFFIDITRLIVYKACCYAVLSKSYNSTPTMQKSSIFQSAVFVFLMFMQFYKWQVL